MKRVKHLSPSLANRIILYPSNRVIRSVTNETRNRIATFLTFLILPLERMEHGPRSLVTVCVCGKCGEFSRVSSKQRFFYLPNRDRLRPIILSRIASPTLEYVPGKQKTVFNEFRLCRGWEQACRSNSVTKDTKSLCPFFSLPLSLSREKRILDSFEKWNLYLDRP